MRFLGVHVRGAELDIAATEGGRLLRSRCLKGHARRCLSHSADAVDTIIFELPNADVDDESIDITARPLLIPVITSMFRESLKPWLQFIL